MCGRVPPCNAYTGRVLHINVPNPLSERERALRVRFNTQQTKNKQGRK